MSAFRSFATQAFVVVDDRVPNVVFEDCIADLDGALFIFKLGTVAANEDN